MTKAQHNKLVKAYQRYKKLCFTNGVNPKNYESWRETYRLLEEK